MSLSRVHTWGSGEVLFASVLNAEFDNILNNAMSLITPLRLENLAVAPAAGTAGRIYFNTVLSSPQIDDGTLIQNIPLVESTSMTPGSVIAIDSAGTGFTLVAQSALTAVSGGWIPQL